MLDKGGKLEIRKTYKLEPKDHVPVQSHVACVFALRQYAEVYLLNSFKLFINSQCCFYVQSEIVWLNEVYFEELIHS